MNRVDEKNTLFLTLMTAFSFCVGLSSFPFSGAPARLTVREVPAKTTVSTPYLFRPVAIVCDLNGVYVLDSGDADIKVFAPDGSFRRSLGKKGSGPGEFRLPGDIDILGGRIYVADSANRRVQVLDGRGAYLEGFGLKAMPWRVLALDEDRIVVVHLPSGLSGPEKLVTCYHRNGVAAWRAVDSAVSGDPVYDALRNQVLLGRNQGGGFWLVRCFDDRVIRRLNREGGLTGQVAPPEVELPFRDISVPTGKGRNRTLRGFCRTCAADGGRLFLLIPEYMEDGDLGPGKTIAVIAESGKVEAIIDLPERISRIAVDRDTIYAINLEPRLRILRMEKK